MSWWCSICRTKNFSLIYYNHTSVHNCTIGFIISVPSTPSYPQGKGAMMTYWIEEKDANIKPSGSKESPARPNIALPGSGSKPTSVSIMIPDTYERRVTPPTPAASMLTFPGDMDDRPAINVDSVPNSFIPVSPRASNERLIPTSILSSANKANVMPVHTDHIGTGQSQLVPSSKVAAVEPSPHKPALVPLRSAINGSYSNVSLPGYQEQMRKQQFVEVVAPANAKCSKTCVLL